MVRQLSAPATAVPLADLLMRRDSHLPQLRQETAKWVAPSDPDSPAPLAHANLETLPEQGSLALSAP